MESVTPEINPYGVYDTTTMARTLGVGKGVLTEACEAGRLRSVRLGRKVVYRGAWVLDWLESVAEGGAVPAPAAVSDPLRECLRADVRRVYGERYPPPPPGPPAPAVVTGGPAPPDLNGALPPGETNGD